MHSDHEAKQSALGEIKKMLIEGHLKRLSALSASGGADPSASAMEDAPTATPGGGVDEPEAFSEHLSHMHGAKPKSGALVTQGTSGDSQDEDVHGDGVDEPSFASKLASPKSEDGIHPPEHDLKARAMHRLNQILRPKKG